MGRRIVFLALVCGMGASSARLEGQTILAPSGRALFSGATLVRSTVEIRRSSLRTDGEWAEVTEYVPSLAVVYGFHPKWTFIAAQPFVSVDASTHVDGSERRESSNGLADARFFVQYDGLYRRNRPGGLTRLSGVFGLQAPTGASRFSASGVEYTGGLVFEKAMNLKLVLSADFEHTFAAESEEGVSVGNRSRFDAASAYFVISRSDPPPNASWLRRFYDRAFRHGAYLVLELNGASQDRAREGDREIEDSGGTVLSISPGIQYFVSDSLLVELSLPIPVVKVLHGVQPEPESSFVFGFRYLF
jgi:hypothetical protein